jgi:hypothetical protein
VVTAPGYPSSCYQLASAPAVTVNQIAVTVQAGYTSTAVAISVPVTLITPPSIAIGVTVTNYGANGCYTGSASKTVPVGKTVTTITLTASPYPTSCGPVTLTATLNAPGASQVPPTGQVTIFDNNGTTNLDTLTLTGGATTVSWTTSLSIGTHYLTASYGGDVNYASSTSPSVTEIVSVLPSLSLAVSPSPGMAGQPVTLIATLSPNPGAGLTVTFLDNATTIGTAVIDVNGVATFTTSALAQGSHPLLAYYSGACGIAQSNTVNETVTAPSTTTTLTALPAQPTVCQQVTLTAAVKPGAAGSVTFLDMTKGKPGSVLASNVPVTVSNALAVAAALVQLPAENAVLEADFTPSSTASSNASSGTMNLTVSQAPTTAQLTVPAAATSCQPVVMTATVAACTGFPPTGTVTFMDGQTTINKATLGSNATATFSTSTLTTGNHTLTATYSGDSNYTGSSGSATETVALAGTLTTLNASPSPVTYGQAVTLNATVELPGAAAPVTASAATGTVTFNDGTVQFGQAALNAGKVTLTSSSLTAGSHSLTAVYNGDSCYAASTSTPPVPETVNKAATVTGIQASAMSPAQGQTVTLTATVTPAGATGTVTFSDGQTSLGQQPLSGGQAAFTTSTLAAGSHSLTASYGGDANHLGSSSGTLSITVGSSLQISSPALSSSPPTKLPAGTLNAPYSQTFTAAGGTPPYKWSLPQSDTKDLQIGAATGILSGTPASTGTFNLTVQVQDSASPPATVQGAYQVTVNYPALPAVSIAVDNSQPSTPLIQPTPTLTLGQAYAVSLSGTATLSFQPSASAAGLPAGFVNPDLAFASGGVSAAVSIPAGSTTVTLPKIQVGTVAGTITATLGALTPAGSSQSLPFTGPAPSVAITLGPAVPLILSVKIASVTASGFQVVINADSTTRDLSLAELVFSSASGTQLSGTTSYTGSSGVSLTTAAPAWFSSTQGVSNGGGFTLTISFGYSGSASALGTVQVTLTNSQGKSAPVSGGQ